MTAAVFSPIEWTAFEGFKNGVPLNVWELEDLLYGFLTPWDVRLRLLSIVAFIYNIVYRNCTCYFPSGMMRDSAKSSRTDFD